MPSLQAVSLTSCLPPVTGDSLPRTLSPPPVLQGVFAALEANLQEASAKVQMLTPSASGSQQAEQQVLARERERISRQLAPAAEREDEMGKALTTAQVCVWGGSLAAGARISASGTARGTKGSHPTCPSLMPQIDQSPCAGPGP